MRTQAMVLVLAWAAAGGLPALAQEAPPAAGAWTADLPVVSDGRHLWMAASGVTVGDRPMVEVFHADATDEAPAWEKVTELRGKLARGAMAAADRELWLVFEDGVTQAVSLRPAPIEGQWFLSLRSAQTLPEGIHIRAMAAGEGRLWALVRVETAEALQRLEADAVAGEAVASDAEEAEVLNLVLGLPRELPLEGESAPPAAEAVPPDEAPTEDMPAEDAKDADAAPSDAAPPTIDVQERLLVWERNRWRVVALPDDWTIGRPLELVAMGPGRAASSDATAESSARPQLVVVTHEGVQGKLPGAGTGVHRWDGQRWSATYFDEAGALPEALPGALRGAGAGVGAVRVGEQLVLVTHQPTPEGFSATASAVRGEKLVEIGRITLGEGPGPLNGGQWAALPWAGGVGVMAADRGVADAVSLHLNNTNPQPTPPGPLAVAIDLHGQIIQPPFTLGVDPVSVIEDTADYVILLGVVLSSTILLFTFWRRDPLSNVLMLPQGVVLADLGRRGVAGLIDVLPGVMLGAWGFGLEWGELYARWPGRGVGATWSLMLPGLVAVGTIVVHTAVLETLTGRSLGKLATGLRVATLNGEPPQAWRTLTRCGLKAFDLVAYLLLVLPMISPYRQRLGDMVAGTVVVANAPKDGDDDAEKSDE